MSRTQHTQPGKPCAIGSFAKVSCVGSSSESHSWHKIWLLDRLHIFLGQYEVALCMAPETRFPPAPCSTKPEDITGHGIVRVQTREAGQCERDARRCRGPRVIWSPTRRERLNWLEKRQQGTPEKLAGTQETLRYDDHHSLGAIYVSHLRVARFTRGLKLIQPDSQDNHQYYWGKFSKCHPVIPSHEVAEAERVPNRLQSLMRQGPNMDWEKFKD